MPISCSYYRTHDRRDQQPLVVASRLAPRVKVLRFHFTFAAQPGVQELAAQARAARRGRSRGDRYVYE
jgi:hypothetical protein